YVGKDEAYLDVTDRVEGSFDKASHLAQQIKNAVREKLKLSCSIGVSSNKLISKIASDFRKPDGLTIVSPENMEEFLEQLKIRVIPGIGKKTEERFIEMNFETIRDVKKLDVFTLNKEFGRKHGTYIFNAVRGIDTEPVKEREASIQYSKLSTLKKDSNDYELLAENLIELCRELHEVIKKNNKTFKSVGIQFIQSDLTSKTKSKMLKNHISSLEELQKNALQLLKESLEEQKSTIRRLGVKVSELAEIQGQSSITNYF
ncbi:MAG TPA: DNA polymerase IV, partial [Nitrosarchaeum sp.]|nr:DNA polymerase IV [Nitrosarchaeum sp.]